MCAMEEIAYLSVRLVCIIYILYKVWGQKKKVRKICDLLYGRELSEKAKKRELEPSSQEQTDISDVVGGTRFIYLDETAGETAAPYMSQPLDMNMGYIDEDEEIAEEEVECKLPLENMKILKEEQVELDKVSPNVDSVSQAVTPADLDNAGDVLFRVNNADKDEEKSRRAALTLHAIRETDLFEVFSSQVENKTIIENLMGKYLDGDGNALPVRKTKADVQPSLAWQEYL